MENSHLILREVSDRVNVLGVEISATNVHNSLATIEGLIVRGERCFICVTGVHGVMESQKDEALKAIHNHSGLTVPDGMPLVWAGRIYGYSDIGRVYGPDLMLEVCRASVKKGFTHFLYGGDEGVAEKLKNNLEQKFPGIQIVGVYTPPFRPLNIEEEEDLKNQVAILKPDFFWAGLSTPKQERFMAEYISKLDTKVMIGVGAAFDYHTGRVIDSPDWMKKIGMQWFHRLCQNPRRLWKRYLINNPIFIGKFLKQLYKDRKLILRRYRL
jgi:N-acetylglucosaminyldiphosphoundecaprenol N-acetyl-beta-D-mannosaminyltransferase